MATKNEHAHLIPAWEADMEGHKKLLAAAKKNGDEEAAAASTEAIKTIKQAIADNSK